MGRNERRAVKQYYTLNGTVIAVRDSSAGVSYIHADHLGSVSATSGAQAGTQTFGPWGNLTSGSSSATARNYTGQYLDSTTGLLYDHARYYDAALGRFISADSIVPGQTATSGAPNPQELNRYSYVANNPLTYNDPSGHADSCFEACGGEAGETGEERLMRNPPERFNPGAEAEPKPLAEAEPVAGEAGPEAVDTPQPGTYEHARRLLGFDPKDSPAKEPYERPSPTYQEQKAVKQAVRGQPCINCGTIEESASHQVANHDPPLAVEYYRNGSIDRANAFSTSRINSMCRICSAKEGYEIKAFIQFMNRLLFGGNK